MCPSHPHPAATRATSLASRSTQLNLSEGARVSGAPPAPRWWAALRSEGRTTPQPHRTPGHKESLAASSSPGSRLPDQVTSVEIPASRPKAAHPQGAARAPGAGSPPTCDSQAPLRKHPVTLPDPECGVSWGWCHRWCLMRPGTPARCFPVPGVAPMLLTSQRHTQGEHREGALSRGDVLPTSTQATSLLLAVASA